MDHDYVDSSTVYIDEKTRNSPPSLSDKIKTQILLEDFGINDNPPCFETYKELNDWKNKQISQVLDCQ